MKNNELGTLGILVVKREKLPCLTYFEGNPEKNPIPVFIEGFYESDFLQPGIHPCYIFQDGENGIFLNRIVLDENTNLPEIYPSYVNRDDFDRFGCEFLS